MSSTSSARFERGRLFSCEGLVAVVTGGGSGLGKSMAIALASNGARVYILGRRLESLEAVAASFSSSPASGSSKVPDSGPAIIPVQCDISSKDALAAAAAQIRAEQGFINLLVANAGTMGPTNEEVAPSDASRASGEPLSLEEAQSHLWRTDMDDFTQVLRVNVVGVHFSVVAFMDLLGAGNKRANVRQSSQVVVTTSIGGFHRNFYNAGIAYTTSKAAANHLVKTLAAFLVRWKIRVNGIAPGKMTATAFVGQDPTQEGSLPINVQPLTRSGREEEIAGTLLYLASEAGGYTSGSIEIVDGGRLGVLPGAMY